MLVLLALIGIVALQVASLQERMSSNYQSTNMAFQNAEAGVRERELDCSTTQLLGRHQLRQPTFRRAIARPPSIHRHGPARPRTYGSMDECFSSGGVDMTSLPEEERTDQIYQITSYRRDRATNPTAEAVINTVYIP